MAIQIISPGEGKRVAPSDNRMVFSIVSSTGIPNVADPVVPNFGNAELGVVSGDINTGVFNLVSVDGQVADFSLPAAFLTPLKEQLELTFPGVQVDPQLSQFKVNSMQIEFAGSTAHITGTIESVKYPGNTLDVDVMFESKMDWSTFSAFGLSPITGVPIVDGSEVTPERNYFEFLPGTAPSTLEEFEDLILLQSPVKFSDLATITNFQSVNDVVTFDSSAPIEVGSGVLTESLRFNSVANLVHLELISHSIGTDAVSFCDNLKYVKFQSNGSITYFGMGDKIISDCPLLETIVLPINTPYEVYGNCPNISEVYILRVTSDTATSVLSADNMSNITLYTHPSNATNNAGNEANFVAGVLTDGGNVVYQYPAGNDVVGNSYETWSFYLLDEDNSGITGTVGSIYEGISLDLSNGTGSSLGSPALLQVGNGASLKTTGLGMSMAFKMGGDTSGSIFINANSYSYKIEVWVNGQYHSTHRVYSRSNGVAYFDASPIAKAVVQKYRIPGAPVQNAFNHGTIRLRAVEFVNGVQVGNEVSSSTIDIFKSRLSEIDFNNWEYGNYIYNGSPQRGKFLSTYPRNEKRLFNPEQSYFLGCIISAQGNNIFNSMKLNYRFGAFAFSLNASVKADLRAITDNPLGLRVKYGAIDLKATGMIALPENTLPLTQSGVDAADFLDLSMIIGSTITGETWRLLLTDESCSRGKTIHFLNKLGAMESFYFPVMRVNDSDVSGFGVKKYTGNFAPSENGNSDFLRMATDRVKLTTDWLPESVHNWLVREVIESPFLLMYDQGYLRRVKVSTANYTEKMRSRDKIFNTTIDFEISETRYSPTI